MRVPRVLRPATVALVGVVVSLLTAGTQSAGYAAAPRLAVAPGDNVLVSVSIKGKPTGYVVNGNVFSGDGRYVAFIDGSTASLVKGVPGGCMQVYRRDLQANKTELVSVSADGKRDDQTCQYDGVSTSGDGRYIAFNRRDNSFRPVPVLSAGRPHYLFVKDIKSGALTVYSPPASVSGEKRFGDYGVFQTAMSQDGKYIAVSVRFQAGPESVYLLNRVTSAWMPITELQPEVFPFSMSADGRYIAMYYLPTNAPRGLPVSALWDRSTGRITTYPTPGIDAGFGPAINQLISPDGKLLYSCYSNMNGEIRYRTVVRDVATGKVLQTIATPGGYTFNALSFDGRYGVIGKDLGREPLQSYRYDRITNTFLEVSVNSHGVKANRETFPAGISNDGSKYLFGTAANNLVPGDHVPDQYVWEGDVDLFVASLPR